MTGVPMPAEWVARGIENRLDWHPTTDEDILEARQPRQDSLADIWRELIPAPEETASPRGA
jgi:hypothetical protein